MLQVCRDAYFGEESLGTKHGAKVRIEDLQCDASRVPHVPSKVDRGHPAPPDLALDFVTPGEADQGVGGFMAPSMLGGSPGRKALGYWPVRGGRASLG